MQHILIIDDDEMIRTIFKRFLEGQGYRVECAVDGRDGLRQLEVEPPDLVITDIMMPDVDGLEVVLAMREKHPGIPVIAISGGMSSLPMDFLPMVEKFNECRVLYKPIALKDLLPVVKQLLELAHD